MNVDDRELDRLLAAAEQARDDAKFVYESAKSALYFANQEWERLYHERISRLKQRALNR